MIVADALTKRFSDTLAVDGISFMVRPGVVTGFLGPNGAGKSTTMRMIIGLDAPTYGSVTVNGKIYRRHSAPLHEVGALLETRAVHNGRSARNHLKVLARTCGIPMRRADELLELVGLTDVAKKRVGGYSLGMGQRLGVAAALLGDPATLILDEPVNGLDPEGIIWIRTLLRDLAAEGRTVLVSSHLMSEMALTADHLIVIGRGRLIADLPMADFIQQSTANTITVQTSQPQTLATAVQADGGTWSELSAGRFSVAGITAERLGDLALANECAIYELTPNLPTLEEAFMRQTGDAVQFHGSGTS